MNKDKTMPIAIIGMGCRLPGSSNTPERLWQLCAEGKNTWSTIPSERFNQKSFHHSKSETLGTFNAKGAHFLNEDVSEWDASFFNFTASMAKSMDPQLRILLETVFEALESAGLPLEEIAGSQTSVFAGTCFKDYHDMLMRDHESLPRYMLSGNLTTMISNRISHFFDLRGPSVSVDTACSTGLTALHLACQSLRTGESKMSIVGGANLLLHPGAFCSLSNLGLLGDDGKSYAFDSRAQGYGRGEGMATIIIKPLQDALKDGDPVRAVIRGTCLNQDGKTPTLTSPSQQAQEALIRECYERSGLDSHDTPYVEAHGTGTASGDTIEVAAMGAAFRYHLDFWHPLILGSIKSNIGHLEASSGLASVMKAVMMLEKGQIPPQALFEKPNPNIDFKELHLEVPQRLRSFPENMPKRISINNFGVGGANAHVIIESAEKYLPKYDMTISVQEFWPLAEDEHGHTGSRYLFALSAKDRSSLRANVRALADCLSGLNSKWSIEDLAYTLNERRSKFPYRVAVTAAGFSDLQNSLTKNDLSIIHTKETPRLGFVFTGQGAQWYAMGRELIRNHPIFESTLKDADMVLSKLGSTWSILDELSKDEASSKVDTPELGFPVTIAVQIALTCLLASWGVRPSAVTGHSSGEIAAAYAAGALSLSEAMTVAYIRGIWTSRLLREAKKEGGMIALGLGKDKAGKLLDEVTSGRLVIACINSPENVTVSGDIEAIDELEILAQERRVFNRRLRVETAYHSHHMDPIALAYLVDLEKSLQITKKNLFILFTSPVSGDVVESSCQVGSRHWVENMIQCVLFDDCLQKMILSKSDGTNGQVPTKNVDILVEIGPHGALAAPIRQILSLPDLRMQGIKYVSCLTRDQDAMRTMQELAGFLFSCGYPVLLQDVNFPQGQIRPRVIYNLPPYHWNHSKKYWAAPLQIQEMFHREFARHELLGVRVEGLSPETPIWRNTLRATDLPWDANQVPCPTVVFKNMVMEAMRQIMSHDATSSAGFEIYDLKMLNNIVVPSNPDGLPIQLTLTRTHPRDPNSNKNEFNFSIDSQTSYNKWTKHCVGGVGAKGQSGGKAAGVDDEPYLIEGLDLFSSDTELESSHEHEKFQKPVAEKPVTRRDSAVFVTPEHTASPEPGSSSAKELLAAAATDQDIREVILNAIQEKIVAISMLDEDGFDIHRSLMDYGVDSLVAVELNSWIATNLTDEARFVDIMESSTVLNLVEKIVSKIV